MQNLKPLTSLCSWAGGFEPYLVANPKDRFSRDEVDRILAANNKGADQTSKVGKVLTARENPGGKNRVFPGWAILPEIAVLGNTG